MNNRPFNIFSQNNDFSQSDFRTMIFSNEIPVLDGSKIHSISRAIAARFTDSFFPFRVFLGRKN